MKRLWIYFIWLPLFADSIVPNRYIVELSNTSVAEQVARTAVGGRGRLAMHSVAAEQHRARIRAEQSAARAAIQRAEGDVVGGVENVSNALFVHIPDAKAARLAQIAGVRKVHPVREFHLLLDHALPLHHVTDAWTQVGIDNAGAGIRIAIIDTGVDIGHPGFQDASFTAPDGFPKANTDSDLAYTNNKVIVARSYAALFARTDPDPSAHDHRGHGTATAMAAAGVQNTGPHATISGVAPKAYIGSYKVFGSPGVNDGASEEAIFKAIDDAVADGMDVISMSLGSDITTRPGDDPQVQALEHAASLGIVVVAAAGNNGPDPDTVASPADAPSVIAVGASHNDRIFAATVLLPDSDPLVAIPGSGPNSDAPITGPLVDVSTLGDDGMACSPLPPNSLQGSVAFILRGVCTFEVKLTNAQIAGAMGALVYTDQDRPDAITMGVGAATLPAEMISYRDGVALKQRLQTPLQATLQFALSAVFSDPARIAVFSAKGPDVDFAIKPDLLAVGTSVYTAAEKDDPQGEIYNPDGYAVEQGTSFSTPLVAGAAALLKAARPGLTAAQYRSLLVNSAAPASLAPGASARVQQGGAGVLDVLAALNATAAAAPVSLSFGSNGPDIDASRNLTISNLGTVSDTFQLSVAQRGDGPAPQLPFASVDLDAGASVSIPVQFTAAALAPGQYEGYVNILGTHSNVTTHVPYWYAVASGQPHYITVLFSAASAQAGSRLSDAVLFRISDESGLPVPDAPLDVTPVSGGGSVTSVRSRDNAIPYAFSLSARLGVSPGPNVFRIKAGDLTKDVTIQGR